MGYSGDRYMRPGRIMSGPSASVLPAGEESRTLEMRAAELHAASRRRSQIFGQPVMADAAMDIMLTGLIAHEQGTVLTRMSATMANCLSPVRGDAVIDDLIAARFMQRGERRDQIALTALGIDLMRQFVENERARTP